MKYRLFGVAVGLMFASYALAAGKTVTVHVTGMVCQFCSQGITKKFGADKAVDSVKVDMEKKVVKLTFKEGKDLSDEKITEIVKDAGVNVERIER